jgi:hypothetical protein
MNTLAFVMILASVVSHAPWNFLAKRGIHLLAEGGSQASPDCSGYDRRGDYRSGFLVR